MFEDKTVLVTGAAKGIGLGIAAAFAKEKAKVVMTDLDEETNENAAKEIGEKTGAQILPIKCDVSKKEEVDQTVEKALNKFGSLDILINNAGIFPYKTFLEMTEKDWDMVFDVNLKSIFLCSQVAVKAMKEGGKIINISSIASLVGFEQLTHYCASKSGINGYTRALALELAPKKINVNVVAPGAIRTPGADWESMSEEQMQQTLSLIPWHRVGLPEDIANAVIFLASPQSDYITGQVLVVDGGWTLR